MKGKRNPVAQHNNFINKSKTFRDRKKDNKRKIADDEIAHPVHQPYRRVHENLTKKILTEDLDDDDE